MITITLLSFENFAASSRRVRKELSSGDTNDLSMNCDKILKKCFVSISWKKSYRVPCHIFLFCNIYKNVSATKIKIQNSLKFSSKRISKFLDLRTSKVKKDIHSEGWYVPLTSIYFINTLWILKKSELDKAKKVSVKAMACSTLSKVSKNDFKG